MCACVRPNAEPPDDLIHRREHRFCCTKGVSAPMIQVLSNTYTPALEDRTLQNLRLSLQGDVIRPDDAGYDSARRVWNGMIDRYPALIVRCADSADVVRTVQFARSHHLPTAVRGGGHNSAGSAVCDGGI